MRGTNYPRGTPNRRCRFHVGSRGPIDRQAGPNHRRGTENPPFVFPIRRVAQPIFERGRRCRGFVGRRPIGTGHPPPRIRRAEIGPIRFRDAVRGTDHRGRGRVGGIRFGHAARCVAARDCAQRHVAHRRRRGRRRACLPLGDCGGTPGVEFARVRLWNRGCGSRRRGKNRVDANPNRFVRPFGIGRGSRWEPTRRRCGGRWPVAMPGRVRRFGALARGGFGVGQAIQRHAQGFRFARTRPGRNANGETPLFGTDQNREPNPKNRSRRPLAFIPRSPREGGPIDPRRGRLQTIGRRRFPCLGGESGGHYVV